MQPATIALDLAVLVAQLCGVIARYGLARGVAGPLIVQIWQRVRRAGSKAEALLARLQAGTVVRHRQRRASRIGPRRRPTAKLPRKRAWLLALVPEAAGNAAQLQHMLAASDIPALLEASPQLRRTLRPLCHMLGVSLPNAAPHPPAAPPPPSGPDPAPSDSQAAPVPRPGAPGRPRGLTPPETRAPADPGHRRRSCCARSPAPIRRRSGGSPCTRPASPPTPRGNRTSCR